ncbi:hypothetical protein DPEC_G00266740 [Dallia pectoralis]|uniref:Uncharacterized protein n=1 Tax=Dallia pectoralis TaxID=75939 RepID=A0ACC2FNE7_DALPE|nr:hypothetical protein DPEC_G00266740 [Dallia pectoralis]
MLNLLTALAEVGTPVPVPAVEGMASGTPWGHSYSRRVSGTDKGRLICYLTARTSSIETERMAVKRNHLSQLMEAGRTSLHVHFYAVSLCPALHPLVAQKNLTLDFSLFLRVKNSSAESCQACCALLIFGLWLLAVAVLSHNPPVSQTFDCWPAWRHQVVTALLDTKPILKVEAWHRLPGTASHPPDFTGDAFCRWTLCLRHMESGHVPGQYQLQHHHACPQGTFKSTQGPALCQQCPPNSRSTAEAATICTCRNGYYRGDMDPPEASCTSVPSGPRNVISVVNETSVILEWQPPRETGARDDVTYNIVCRKCHADWPSCSNCDDSVEYIPRQQGLMETTVFISNLWAHTPYAFEIHAINGVTNKSPYPAQHVSINITTNQAAPSLVPIMHQVSSTMKSFTLSWPQPEQPNGKILEYELRYYEKKQRLPLNMKLPDREGCPVVSS